MLLATLDVLYLHNTIPEKNIDQCRPTICQCTGFVFLKQKNECLHNQRDSHIPFYQSGPRYRTEIDSECIGCQPLCKSCNLLDLDTKANIHNVWWFFSIYILGHNCLGNSGFYMSSSSYQWGSNKPIEIEIWSPGSRYKSRIVTISICVQSQSNVNQSNWSLVWHDIRFVKLNRPSFTEI